MNDITWTGDHAAEWAQHYGGQVIEAEPAGLTTTKLYNVTSVIDGWPHRGSVYDGVRVTWFVLDRDTDPGFDYPALLDGLRGGRRAGLPR